MRTRDEVLKAFGISAAQFAGDYELKMADHIVAVEKQRDEYHAMWKQETLAKRKLADRIRELESQLALPPIREKFVRVSDELVAELKAAPSKPVTVAIVEDGNELHMTFTEAQQAASAPVEEHVSDPYQFAAPFAWILVKNGKPQGIPVAHRPSDWPEVQRAWGATFVPLYPQKKSPEVLELLEREWIAACEIVRDYCRRHGITEYGRSVFALLVEDAERLRAHAPQSAAAVTVTEDEEKITMTVGPVTEAEAIAALKRLGWTEQASLFGSFRSLVAPEPAASEGASDAV